MDATSKTSTPVPAFAGVTGEAYITVLGGRYPGYVVAVPLPDLSGEVLRRVFHGLLVSPEAHLRRAVRCRDAAYKRLYGEPLPVRAFHQRQSNGTTGIPGVRFLVRRIRRRNDRNRIYEVPVFLAEVWLVPGKDGRPPKHSRSKQFATSKYGHEEALSLAVQWREAAMEALRLGKSLPTGR